MEIDWSKDWQRYWILIAEYLGLTAPELQGKHLFHPTLRRLQKEWTQEMGLTQWDGTFFPRMHREWAAWLKTKIDRGERLHLDWYSNLPPVALPVHEPRKVRRSV